MPRRFNGREAACARLVASGSGSKPVSMRPGAIALTRMPWGASSWASARVKVRSPPLAGVRGVVRAADVRELRAEKDDPPAALRDHDARGFARAEEGAAQMHGHHPLPVVQGHLRDGLRLLDARVVDEHVETAEALHHAPHECLDVRFARHVAAHRQASASSALDLGDERSSVRLPRDPRNGDVGAFVRVGERDTAPDPRVAPGDQRDLPGEPPRLRAIAAVELVLDPVDGALQRAHVGLGPLTRPAFDVHGDPARERAAAHDRAQHLGRHPEDRHELGRRRRLDVTPEIVLDERPLGVVEPANAARGALVDRGLTTQRLHARRERFGRHVIAVQPALGEIDAERDAGGAGRVAERGEDLAEASPQLDRRLHLPVVRERARRASKLPRLALAQPDPDERFGHGDRAGDRLHDGRGNPCAQRGGKW